MRCITEAVQGAVSALCVFGHALPERRRYKKDRELGIKWMREAAVKGQFFAFDELRKLTGGK